MKPKDAWNLRPEIVNAGLKGWNASKMLPVALKDAYSHMRGYTIALFSEDDVPHRVALGYDFVTVGDFPDWDDLNDMLPIRFGISKDASGKIKYKKMFLMYMPEDYRKELRRKIDDAAERRVNLNPGEYRPGDKIIDGYEVVDSKVESVEPNAKKEPPKRGRPPKGK